MFLQEKFPETLMDDSIKWNFTKFLVDREGKVVGVLSRLLSQWIWKLQLRMYYRHTSYPRK